MYVFGHKVIIVNFSLSHFYPITNSPGSISQEEWLISGETEFKCEFSLKHILLQIKEDLFLFKLFNFKI